MDEKLPARSPSPNPMAATEMSGEDEMGWVTTYGDLMSVLLVFFIMLFGISTVDTAKFAAMGKTLAQSMGGRSFVADMSGSSLISDSATGVDKLAGGEPAAPVRRLEEDPSSQLEDLSKLASRIEDLILKEKLDPQIEIKLDHRGVVIYAAGNAFFNSGEAQVLPQARPFLDKVSALLGQVPYKVLVEGHTDEAPISTAHYPTNWELSTGRAASVVRYFIEVTGLLPERLSAVGYSHYKPRYPLRPEYRAKNRRVEIIVLRERTRPLEEDFETVLDVETKR